jgi:hypothetical protein
MSFPYECIWGCLRQTTGEQCNAEVGRKPADPNDDKWHNHDEFIVQASAAYGLAHFAAMTGLKLFKDDEDASFACMCMSTETNLCTCFG